MSSSQRGSEYLVVSHSLAAAVGSLRHHNNHTRTLQQTPTPTHASGVSGWSLQDLWGKPNAASWIVAAGVNAAVLGYFSYRLYRNAVVEAEKHKQLKRSAQRLYVLATQGADAAGPVPEDLGQPDAAGVYTKHTATGTLYFRQAQPHLGVAPHWEWSTDRALWIPTSYADSLWYSSEHSPSTADHVLIRRLEVEGQLLSRQHGGAGSSSSSSSAAAAAGALLPPLDLSQSQRDLTRLADVPTTFLCPISMQLMTQPVVTPSGATFDRAALLDWIRQFHTDPLSAQPLSSDQLVSNLVLRDMLHAWLHEGPHATSNSSGDSSSNNASHSTNSSEPAAVVALAAAAAAAAVENDAVAQQHPLRRGDSPSKTHRPIASVSTAGAAGGDVGGVSGSDSHVLRDVTPSPSTPVRASRDV